MGKNVKGFEKGDRCVADVGITVCGECKPIDSVDSSCFFFSAGVVFTAGVAKSYFVNTLTLEG